MFGLTFNLHYESLKEGDRCLSDGKTPHFQVDGLTVLRQLLVRSASSIYVKKGEPEYDQ